MCVCVYGSKADNPAGLRLSVCRAYLLDSVSLHFIPDCELGGVFFFRVFPEEFRQTDVCVFFFFSSARYRYLWLDESLRGRPTTHGQSARTTVRLTHSENRRDGRWMHCCGPREAYAISHSPVCAQVGAMTVRARER